MTKLKARPKPAFKRGNRSTMRSGFEKAASQWMDENGVQYGYEVTAIPYVVPMKKRKYHPDFDVGDTHYEFKGRFLVTDRQKMLLVKEQNPHVKIVLVFQRPNNKVLPGRPATYGEWATKNGFEWMTYPEFQARMLREKGSL